METHIHDVLNHLDDTELVRQSKVLGIGLLLHIQMLILNPKRQSGWFFRLPMAYASCHLEGWLQIVT